MPLLTPMTKWSGVGDYCGPRISSIKLLGELISVHGPGIVKLGSWESGLIGGIWTGQEKLLRSR